MKTCKKIPGDCFYCQVSKSVFQKRFQVSVLLKFSRKCQFERSLKNMKWKILEEDLKFPTDKRGFGSAVISYKLFFYKEFETVNIHFAFKI